MNDRPTPLGPTPEPPTRGWGWPTLSKKAHYFIDGRAICGRWAYFGRLEQTQSGTSKQDCAECTRRKAKLDAAD